MPIVDSHCHVATNWYDPVEVLLFHMDRNRVQHAVLVQMNGQTDNSYQMECLRRYPGRFASVVIVDEQSPNAVQELDRLAAEGASGVRLSPDVRSPGDDPLAIWRAAERLGLSVSLRGGEAEKLVAPEFEQLVKTFPRLNFVIEHLGGRNNPDGNPPIRLRERVFELNRYDNVYIKVHGIGEFATRAMPPTSPFPFKEPVPAVAEMAYRAFGPEHMMWGSDFPPVSAREGYTNALRLTMELFSNFSDEVDQLQVFGGTALRVFPVR